MYTKNIVNYLQYKMFLLNENLEYHAEGILKVFTIQNVPIKL